MTETEAVFYDHETDAPARPAIADWGGDDVFATAPRRRFARPERGGAHHAPPPRRTVQITGRPEPLPTPRTSQAAIATHRRRPTRTVDQRIGGRPDRVAAWACGLGLMLILVAVTTADAAPL